MKPYYNTCLLIDDSYIDNYINQKLLVKYNFARDILVYQKPLEALEALLNGTVKPDVIFLDLQMPVVNGFDFLEAYGKMDINKEGIKLYMLSSTINPVEIKRFELNKLVTKFIGKALTPTMIKSLKLNAVK